MKGSETNGQYSKIDQNTSLKGTIKAKTDIRIDGSVEGNVATTGKVILGKEAKVSGEVSCSNAEEGEVLTQKLIVEAGAIFNAQCKMQTSEEGVKKLRDSHEKTA